MGDQHVLHPSHSFPVTTLEGQELDLGPVVNALLTTRRNHERDRAEGAPTASTEVMVTMFEVGIIAAVKALCGFECAEDFKRHCDELWALSRAETTAN